MDRVEEEVTSGNKDRNVKSVVAATGAAYSFALAEVRRRSSVGELKAYMMMIKATPEWESGRPIRCVRCLMNAHGKCEL